MQAVKTNVKESSSSTQPSPLCTSDRTHPNSPEHTSLKIDPLNLPTEPPLIIDSPSPPNHHRNESTDSSYYSDTETSNGINTSPHAKRRTSRKNLTQSDSKLGLNDILSGDLKNPNLVRIEVPLGKPIEEVYEGVHDGPVLGSGISGIVRLCKHRTTQTEYAVKCLDLALIDSEEGLKQLKEEIYIMCQLVSTCSECMHLYIHSCLTSKHLTCICIEIPPGSSKHCKTRRSLRISFGDILGTRGMQRWGII